MTDTAPRGLEAWATAEAWAVGDLSYKLHDGQRGLVTQWRASTARKSAWNCARRFGKSTLLCVLALEHAIRQPGARVIFAAPTRDQARDIIIPLMSGIIEDCPENLKPQWHSAEHRYKFANGSEIKVDGADDDRGNHLRGTGATLVLCDESGFWRHTSYVINSVLLPQTMLSAGRIIIASTPPESVGHEFWGFVAEAKANGTYSQRTIYDNPMVTAALLEEFIRESGGEHTTTWRREYLCEAVTEAARAVLPEFDEAVHVGEPNYTPRFCNRWVTIDLGMTDLTHCLWGHYDFEKAQHVVVSELVRQYTPVSELAVLINDVEQGIWGDVEPDRRISDNHPMEIAEFIRQHTLQPLRVRRRLVFEPASERSPEVCLNRLRTLLMERRLVISPKCGQLIHQAKVGVWKENRSDFERLPGIGHLDGVMALSYLAANWDYNKNPIPKNAYYQRDNHMLNPFNYRKRSDGLASLTPRARR